MLASMRLGDSVPFLVCLFPAGFNIVGELLFHYRPAKSNPLQFAMGLRLAELGFIAVGSSQWAFREDRLWLLAIPILVFDALAEGTPVRSLWSALLIGTTGCVFNDVQHGPLAWSAAPLLACGGAVAFAYLLINWRSRDQMLASRDRRLAALLETATAVGAAEIERTFQRTIERAVNEVGAAAGVVLVSSGERSDQLVPGALHCLRDDLSFAETFAVGDGPSGEAAASGQPVFLSAGSKEKIHGAEICGPVKAMVSVPLVTSHNRMPRSTGVQEPVGAMTLVFCDDGDAIETDDVEFLQSLASILGTALMNQRLEERQRQTSLQTLESLAAALEARDEYCRGHSYRVCEVSMLLAQSLGLGEKEIEELRVATLLHDLGKIGIPDVILKKPSALTEEEALIMRQHPVIGYDICKPLELSPGVLNVIRNHHERIDGTGYPDKLIGGDLTLQLRIVGVADAFDAMCSPRPYRDVMEVPVAVLELQRASGTQVDGQVVRVLEALIDSGRLEWIYGPKVSAISNEAA